MNTDKWVGGRAFLWVKSAVWSAWSQSPRTLTPVPVLNLVLGSSYDKLVPTCHPFGKCPWDHMAPFPGESTEVHRGDPCLLPDLTGGLLCLFFPREHPGPTEAELQSSMVLGPWDGRYPTAG